MLLGCSREAKDVEKLDVEMQMFTGIEAYLSPSSQGGADALCGNWGLQ